VTEASSWSVYITKQAFGLAAAHAQQLLYTAHACCAAILGHPYDQQI
jgi:hypothetical protein